jgi:CRP/FNR family transcriptional regulator, anaerobic regulatory protein
MEALRKLKIFDEIPAADLKRLLARAKLLKIVRGRSIIVEGRSANETICVLLSGVVKVSAVNSELTPVLMGVVVAGEVFGLHSLLHEPVHTFRCDAFTDCVVAQLPGRTFCQAVLPQVTFDQFRAIIEMSLGRWWWGLPIWYSRMTRLSVHDRVIAMLQELSRKFGVTDARGTIINLPLSRDGLAELIGASRQTVSLEIEDLVRRGWVIRDGRRLLLAKSPQGASTRRKL